MHYCRGVGEIIGIFCKRSAGLQVEDPFLTPVDFAAVSSCRGKENWNHVLVSISEDVGS